MGRIPFSLYDFFGYLASGLLLTVGGAHALNKAAVITSGFSTSDYALLVVVVYILGHINSSLARWFLESIVVNRVLGDPVLVLLDLQVSRIRLLTWMFPGYYKKLAIGVKQRLFESTSARGVGTDARVVFYHAHTLAKRDPITWGRLESFLSLYGFCRNICFALIALSLMFAYSTTKLGTEYHYHLLASTLGAVAMFYRYLKFYRLFSFELFSSYPDLKHEMERG